MAVCRRPMARSTCSPLRRGPSMRWFASTSWSPWRSKTSRISRRYSLRTRPYPARSRRAKSVDPSRSLKRKVTVLCGSAEEGGPMGRWSQTGSPTATDDSHRQPVGPRPQGRRPRRRAAAGSAACPAALGGVILDAVVAEAKRRHYSRIQPWTHEDNERSHRLYAAAGSRQQAEPWMVRASGRARFDGVGYVNPSGGSKRLGAECQP
jgi:hypothetical protein